MSSLEIIKKNFYINRSQESKFQKFIQELVCRNKETNLVGKSTLVDPWRSHILDSIQIAPFITKKNSLIFDMGTGAGLPGLVLAIMGFKRVCLIDSNSKKIKFIKSVCKKLNINASVILGRIEKTKKIKYDVLISRALASLNNLFTYSHNLINEDTVLIFLKGKTAMDEIEEAKKNWIFHCKIHQSLSDNRGKILIINKLSTK